MKKTIAAKTLLITLTAASIMGMAVPAFAADENATENCASVEMEQADAVNEEETNLISAETTSEEVETTQEEVETTQESVEATPVEEEQTSSQDVNNESDGMMEWDSEHQFISFVPVASTTTEEKTTTTPSLDDPYSLPNGHYRLDNSYVYADDNCVAILYDEAINGLLNYHHGTIFIKNTAIWDGDGLTQINGTPLSDIIVHQGRSFDGCVSSIVFKKESHWWYDYTLYIKGKTGSLYGTYKLSFTDGEPDTYVTTIEGSEEKTYSKWYNSKSPYILKIDWEY